MPSFLTTITPVTVRARLTQPVYAQAVADALTGPLPGGCGRQRNKDYETLCRVRLVLEALGILKKGYYTFAGKQEDGKAGIIVLQRALGIAEGAWGPETNGALSAVIRTTLGVPYDTSRTDRPWVVTPGGGGGKAPPPPQPPPPQPPVEPVVVNGGGGGLMLRAGIPILLLGGAIVSWLMFRKGKKTGLAGCNCGMGAFDDRSEADGEEEWEDDDGESGNDEAESARAVRSIPQFPAARAA